MLWVKEILLDTTLLINLQVRWGDLGTDAEAELWGKRALVPQPKGHQTTEYLEPANLPAFSKIKPQP